MGLTWAYRGATTRELYWFNQPLVNPQGQPVTGGQYSTIEYNGETLVVCNRDGSVMMATAGPSEQIPSAQTAIGTQSLPTVTPSAWDSAE